jgi:hypothetical protein
MFSFICRYIVKLVFRKFALVLSRDYSFLGIVGCGCSGLCFLLISLLTFRLACLMFLLCRTRTRFAQLPFGTYVFFVFS